MAERVAVVTGASAGIGLHTALGLARAGFAVTLVGRNRSRIDAARRFVADAAPAAALDTALADFSRLDEVRALAAALIARHPRIDLLVNNAGMIARRPALSAEGYELTLAVNHLAPFLLTNLLLPLLRESAPARIFPARIVTVASAAHRGARIDPATMARPVAWTPLTAYGRSKLANILFTRALARRLDPGEIVATCLHPGMIATDIGNRAGTLAGLGWRLVKRFLPGPDAGAETSLFLATAADPARFHGAYVIGRATAEPDRPARDDRLAEAVWEESTRLVEL